MVSNPLLAYGLGVSDKKPALFLVNETASNQALWFLTNPITGSPFHSSSNLLHKDFVLIKGHLVFDDVITGPCQFMSQCLCRYNIICLRRFL